MINLLFTCSNGEFSRATIDLISEIKYVDKVFFADVNQSNFKLSPNIIVPHGKEENYVETIIKLCREKQINFIIPGSDYEIYSISKELSLFKENKINSFCPNMEVVTILSDKAIFFESLKNAGMKMDFFVLDNWEDVYKYKTKLSYPNIDTLIIKPRISSGSKGVWHVDVNYDSFSKKEIIKGRTYKGSIKSCIKFMKENLINPKNYLVQPYYGSNVYDVDNLYIKNCDNLIQVCRKRIYQDEFSPVNQGCLITKRKEIHSYVKDIYKSLNIEGFLDLDIVIDKNNEVFVIDASARLSGSIISSAQCGVNFIKILLDYYVKDLAPASINIEDSYVIPYMGFMKIN